MECCIAKRDKKSKKIKKVSPGQFAFSHGIPVLALNNGEKLYSFVHISNPQRFG